MKAIMLNTCTVSAFGFMTVPALWLECMGAVCNIFFENSSILIQKPIISIEKPSILIDILSFPS